MNHKSKDSLSQFYKNSETDLFRCHLFCFPSLVFWRKKRIYTYIVRWKIGNYITILLDTIVKPVFDLHSLMLPYCSLLACLILFLSLFQFYFVSFFFSFFLPLIPLIASYFCLPGWVGSWKRKIGLSCFFYFAFLLHKCVNTVLASTLTSVHCISAFSLDDWFSYWVVCGDGWWCWGKSVSVTWVAHSAEELGMSLNWLHHYILILRGVYIYNRSMGK